MSANLPSNSNAIWLPKIELVDPCLGLNHPDTRIPKIVEYTVDQKVPGTVPLKIYLRFPMSLAEGEKVKGVVCASLPQRTRDALMQQLLTVIDPKEDVTSRLEQEGCLLKLIPFAEQHGFALVTWSTPGNWDKEKSYYQMGPDEAKDLDSEFKVLADAWESGMQYLISTYDLPSSDYLLYGESRGAQWAHRVIMRKPSYFMAIHIATCSSYDMPSPEAKKCFWLVTTGEQEVGYAASQRFYADCQKLGYPIIFKAQPNLGHEHSLAADKLESAFFDYALAQQAKLDPNGQGFDFPSLTGSPVLGDYLAQVTSPPDRVDKIDDESKVFLPTNEIAQSWALIDPPQRGGH